MGELTEEGRRRCRLELQRWLSASMRMGAHG
jgi:hypothetical protein